MNRTEIEVESTDIGVRFICGGCRKGINYLQDICRTCSYGPSTTTRTTESTQNRRNEKGVEE